MPKRLNLPDTASVATPDAEGRLFAPSAARNAEAIVALTADILEETTGRALEIASGTGQHITALAAALPDIHWQPSDIDPDRRKSIDAYAKAAALPNIAPAIALDATSPGWGAAHTGQAFICLANLLHLISEKEARILISEAAQALAPNGRLMIYGPFMRDDDLTSEGDASFHASLVAQDPEIGYKSDFDVVEWGLSAWLEYDDMVEMPANNLSIIWRKPS
ncbi:MAG: class I SAM-dependent methyltransferase [Pseudopelagicola sp.]|nr:class I SAM-dependent methyltransferase [Pseudopelagicola sp.]